MTSQIRRQPRGGDERPPATLSYGDEFGPYVITGFAGSGATSYVYQARRRDRFEPVAIKVLHPHLVADPTRRLTFYREARIMMRMDHGNVVRFERIVEDGDTLAFVMEYVDGLTLDQWCRRYADDIDEVALACVFVDILRGVTAAHRQGVIHRDLKPGNVLVTESEGRAVAKIIDFGVARFVDEPLTSRERSKVIGTAAYISPEEVVDPESVCQASDLYSIGVMLYEAACGQRPFAEMEVRDLLRAHARQAPQRPTRLNPELSRSFEDVILQTLDKTPGSRISTAPELIGALEAALHGTYRGASGEPHKSGRPSDVEELEEARTTQWERTPDDSADERTAGRAVGRFFRRCLQTALVLITATGAEDGDDDRHYLNRSPDPGVPFR